jgi:hypothetical protein
MALTLLIKNSFMILHGWTHRYRIIDNRIKSVENCPEFNIYRIIGCQYMMAYTIEDK